MAHEITNTDHVVLHRERAWHGLGTVVADAPTPAEALKLARLDWTVEQWAMSATNGDARVALTDHRLNVRSDTHEQLGIVGKGYQPLQNAELADFAQALASEGDIVRCETAGSIRGGRKVWFLLKGESFSVRNLQMDEIRPYILLSNGHDGNAAIRCTPTTVRVVCSNTLHMVIPDFEVAKPVAREACFVARHSGDLAAKIEEARGALELYGRSLERQRELIDELAFRSLNTEALTRFLGEVYAKHHGAIPANPKTEKDQKARDKAAAALSQMLGRFDRETPVSGPTLWTAVNAYTGWLQHDVPARGRDDDKRRDNREASLLFGVNAERSLEALVLAVQAL